MIMRQCTFMTIAVSASIWLAGCGPVASETEEARRTDGAFTEVITVERGHAAFITSCASCHNEDGRGGGPVAEFLTIPVPDLTLLANEYDGHFPEELVFNTIDGRRNVPAHGSREMPVWGNIDRKSTRLNSSHVAISYAVLFLKKKTGKSIATLPTASPGAKRTPIIRS